ncbi:mitochondrial import inner membrane translocase subunit Tim21 isoform X2 [Echinops telfairi]|uniref:Mitochondrial import inner membrane translocase subunit Tim21 isoform X2 n=1 Tax=Echinops telfairi TaxID=9371 RepID=A0AC55DK15_ECHTE|nr:mitochondrial import inner membrane translocase subunit Tim21 isoform X2 [Echinops telfairi]
MICALLRAVQHAERLHRAAGVRILLPRAAPSTASLHTRPSGRWSPPESPIPARTPRVLAVTPRTIWTQGWNPRRAKEVGRKQVSVHRSPGGEPAVSTTQKVKEAGRDLTYFLVVLVGLGITGWQCSPVVPGAPSLCLISVSCDFQVTGILGEPIKGYGETTHRGRRQHVSYLRYTQDGLHRMRLKFYIEGSEPGKQGTVHLEVKENPESGQYEFLYILVEVDTYPRRVIVVEDHRS